MIGISIETPSVKEGKIVELRIKNTIIYDSTKKDYLKLVKDREGNLLGVINKFSKEYTFFMENISDEIKNGIKSLVSV